MTHLQPPTDESFSRAWALRPLSWGYSAGRFAHRGVYRARLKRRRRLGAPVLCVGNLTVGGTGKTPFLIRLAGEIKALGRGPAILSRGYGAHPPADRPRIVSDGENVYHSPRESGDEPYLLALRSPGVPVVIGKSRYEAGLLARREFDPDLLLLDDGFQHEALHREVDLVLWDLRDVPSKMRLLPSGRLREGLGGLGRATAILLTHAEYLRAEQRSARREVVVAELKSHAPRVPIFDVATRLTALRPVGEGSGAAQPIEALKGRRLLLVSGLARPLGFEAMVRAAGAEVARHLCYADHAEYDSAALEEIVRAFEEARADLVLTTEKDAVKLERLKTDGLPMRSVGLALEVSERERWEPFLQGLLDRYCPVRRKPSDD